MEDEEWFASLRRQTVSEDTRQKYESREKLIQRVTGGNQFGHIIQYFKTYNAHVVATKRGSISAVAHVRWCAGDPLTKDEIDALE